MAEVREVLPWSMCPIVPTLQCALLANLRTVELFCVLNVTRATKEPCAVQKRRFKSCSDDFRGFEIVIYYY